MSPEMVSWIRWRIPWPNAESAFYMYFTHLSRMRYVLDAEDSHCVNNEASRRHMKSR